MLVSWNWLRDYVEPPDGPDEVGQRLMAAGLNLESVASVDGDAVLDLEVTSNRPDCLGHIGVAREIAAIYELPLTIPEARVPAAKTAASSVVSVSITDPDACPRYLARVMRGVTVGPSPDWLVTRLAAIGQQSVNNIVDATNYALMESGQPFHAFDLAAVRGGEIVVRGARTGETIAALNQKDGQETYKLDSGMLVIADAERPIAIAGIMGGLETGVDESTTDLLLETADFAALAIRATARKLGLFSPSQYRFERGVDRASMEWASRRCASLILEVAGGTLLDGFVEDFPRAAGPPDVIRLRFERIERLLGIPVLPEDALAILERLGLEVVERTDGAADVRPPTWRRDLTREVDLIEEIARLVGYDAIPDSAVIPLSLSRPSELDRVRDRVREVLVGHGFHEALSLSFVSAEELALFDPLRGQEALSVEHSSRRLENQLRKSLVPSLLRGRRDNERKGNFEADLFEIAKVYLAAAPGQPEAEVEPLRVGLVSGRSFSTIKGAIEQVVGILNPKASLEARPSDLAEFAAGRGAELRLGGQRLGWLGQLTESARKSPVIDLRDDVTVAEIDFSVLAAATRDVAVHRPVPAYPAVERDLNLVLGEEVCWSDLERAAREAAGPALEQAEFVGQFRGHQLGAGKKSYVIRLVFRSQERTLTNEEVDESVANVVDACQEAVGATLRA